MNFKKFAVIVCSGILAACMFTGCTTTSQSNLTDAQKANREYMSSVNQKMVTLGTTLESFNDAVSREDVVSMKAQAANATKVLNELDSITAPDGFTEIHANYVNGAKSLGAALDAYAELYSEIKSASSFDWSSYNQRIATIQSYYDQGVSSLKAGDDAVSAKE